MFDSRFRRGRQYVFIFLVQSSSFFCHCQSHSTNSTIVTTEKGVDRLSKLEKDLGKIESTILEKEADLMSALPAWEDAVTSEKSARERLETINTTLRTLVAKRGRTTQFKNQKDRDNHLRAEISSREGLVNTREAREKEIERDLKSTKFELEEISKKSGELRRELDGRKEMMKELSEERDRLRTEELAKNEKRKSVIFPFLSSPFLS